MPSYPVQSTMVGYLVASLQTILFISMDVLLIFELWIANTNMTINKRLKTVELKLLYIKQNVIKRITVQ